MELHWKKLHDGSLEFETDFTEISETKFDYKKKLAPEQANKWRKTLEELFKVVPPMKNKEA